MIDVEKIEQNLLNYRLVPLDVKRPKSKNRLALPAISVHIPWLTIALGFFLARALMLDELLPFGIAFLAAVYKSQKLRPGWAMISIGIGYISLASHIDLFPYYIATLLIWLVGHNKMFNQKDGYWIFWFFVSLVAIKAPLVITRIDANYPMIWISAVSEFLLATAAYSMFSAFINRKRTLALESKEFQMIVLLFAIFLGVDLMVGQLPLRIMIMFYLILAAARLGGATLALIVGPIFAVFGLLLRFPLELVVLVTTVTVLAGFLVRFPFGLFLASIVGYLLSFGVPVVADTVPFIIILMISSAAVYLTPAVYLRKLERLIPGTKKYSQRQASYASRSQVILDKRVEQFSQVFNELAVALEENGFIAKQLASLAEVVTELRAGLNTKVEFAEMIEDKLWEDLDSPELAELTVLNTNETYNIVGKRLSRCGEQWCSHVAKVSGKLLGDNYIVTRRNCLSIGKCGFDISSKPRYVVDVKTSKIAHGKVSGDCNTVFPLSSSRVAVLISDGMGTGAEALNDSLATIKLLEKMLRIGYAPELAVEVLNQTLLARSSVESFATVDFVVVNLNSGQLEFIKVGSAASFIKRGRHVEVIQNHSLPIGILNHIEVEPERRLINEGEYLVMLTDGVLEFQRDAVDKDKWLCNLLRNVEDDLSCQDLANFILFASIEAAGGAISDDMTVLVAKIIRNDLEIYPYQRS